jgi:exosome complex exonuclease DIS3/RRP44
MKDSTQLLDLLAAAGSDEIEPTRAVAGRQALYTDVRVSTFMLFLTA